MLLWVIVARISLANVCLGMAVAACWARRMASLRFAPRWALGNGLDLTWDKLVAAAWTHGPAAEEGCTEAPSCIVHLPG